MAQFRLARLCLMLAAIGVSAPALVTSAHAQQKTDAPAAAAPAKDTVRPEIFKLLDPTAIKPLMDAKNYTEVQSRITQAEAFPNQTPYEQYVVNRMKLSLGSTTNNNALAMPALEAVINSNRLTGAEQANFMQALGNMHFNAKDYPKAIEWFKRYQKESPTPEAVRPALVRAYYLNNDFATAKTELSAMMAESAKTGKAPSEEELRLLATAANKTKDDAGYLMALEQLVRYYPKDEFWVDLLSRGVARKAGFDEPTFGPHMLRLEFAAAKNDMPPEHYTFLAETSLRDGFPAEAKQVLDAGFAAGVLGKGGDAKTHNALRGKATKQAADDAKNIAAGEASAAKSKTGAGLVNIGWAYATMDQADKGIGFIQQGIAKGGLKNADEAKLRLGMAQVRAGKKAEAIQTFESVKGGKGASDLAKYWIMFLNKAA
ncbi:tetratricopeptide repeat protein [Telluria aromaticivorans]|uniref:Tetratricopeptide repeat protein n=1 Tax=Telluria aromaticivorans TaxID=2725995 RepID=A0A7Y2K1N4_9BURK|nr:tetratricopeptide repeat protein [Telluria aromaticivorans]NNG24483.1 tetratricopeptide repeat protein [Telluria aromaticivorans]